jgi:hypothetical protein
MRVKIIKCTEFSRPGVRMIEVRVGSYMQYVFFSSLFAIRITLDSIS